MFRAELISAHRQEERETRRRETEWLASTEREVHEYISHVFGPKWAKCAKVKRRNVEIEDIKLFVGRNTRLCSTNFPNEVGTFTSTGHFLLLRGQCPHCGKECWSRECYSIADVGEQLMDFQVSWTRHACVPWHTGLRRFLLRIMGALIGKDK